MKDGKIRATLAVNRFKDIRPSRGLIGQGIPVEAEKLQDEGIDLKSLLPQVG